MTKLLPCIAITGVVLVSGCATTEPDWRYSQPAYPPAYCDPTQEYCPPAQECAPGQYCEPGAYPPGTYAPGPGYPPPGYLPPDAYGRGDRDEDERREHGRGQHEHVAPAPPHDRGDRHDGDEDHAHDR